MDDEGFVSPNELLRRLDVCLASRPTQLVFGACADGIGMDGASMVFDFSVMARLYSFCWQQLRRVRGANAPELVMRLSLPLLMVNGANYSALNARKEALLKQGDGALLKELTLIELVQSKHPKEGDLFVHRQFCLSHLQSLEDVLLRELEVCSQLVERYARNYLAFKHRLFIAQLKANDPTFLAADCARMERFVDPSSASYCRAVRGLIHRCTVSP
jgi:hypothetical protein